MRILLVGDEQRMVQALCEILRLEEYEAESYANGISGLAALFRKIRYNIISFYHSYIITCNEERMVIISYFFLFIK